MKSSLPFLLILLLPLFIFADQPSYRMVSPKMKDGSDASPQSTGPIVYDDKPVYKKEIDIKDLKEQMHNAPIETNEPTQNVSAVPSASFKEKMITQSGVKSTVEVILDKQTKISAFLDFLSDKPDITSYEMNLFEKVKEYINAASSESTEYSSEESIQKDLASIKFKVAKIQKRVDEKRDSLAESSPPPAPKNQNPPPSGLKNQTNSTQEEEKKGLLKSSKKNASSNIIAKQSKTEKKALAPAPKNKKNQSPSGLKKANQTNSTQEEGKKGLLKSSKKNASSNIIAKHPKTKLNLSKIKLIKKAEVPKVVVHKVEKKVSSQKNKKKTKHYKKSLRDLLLQIDEEKSKLDVNHEEASKLYEELKKVEIAIHNVNFRTIALKIKKLRKKIKGIDEDMSLAFNNCEKELKKHNRKELKKLVQDLLSKESEKLVKLQEKINKEQVLSEKVKGLLKKKIVQNESEIKAEIAKIQKEFSLE